MKKTIYLDNAATTQVDPRVVSRMMPHLYERFGNASSKTHAYGWNAEEAIELAREETAALIGCAPSEIVWTSGATEANNLALQGALRKAGCGHALSVASEHASVLEPLRALQREGFELTLLEVGANGLLDMQRFAAALRPDTVLASVMWVNNETGAIQDIEQLAAICRAHGALLHVDAAQAVGKLQIDLARMPIDLLSLSAHKIHGPQGIGALYVRDGVAERLAPQLLGGGQQGGLRAGTLPLHQIVGLGEALRLAHRSMAQDNDRVRWLRERLWGGLAQLDGVFLNGDAEHCIPHTLNLGFGGIDAAALIERLAPQLALSSGSACASTHLEPSHVLRAMGRSDAQARSSLRLSLGRYTTAEDIDAAIALIAGALSALRVAHAPAAGDEDCPMKRLRRRGNRAGAELSVTK